MSVPRKLHFKGTCLFVTTSVEEGLMLPCNPLIDMIIESALARAQHLHPVRICHFCIEATHLHMVLVVDDPNDIKGFMERFKTESAHGINRMIGREKRTVWCESYDSPVLLTPNDVARKITYLYINPAKDGLEQSIEQYPGLTSWWMWRDKKFQKNCPWIRRPAVPEIGERNIGREKCKTIANRLKSEAKESYTLTIYPNAWLECFEEDFEEEADYERHILESIKDTEEQYFLERKMEGRSVIGRKRLMNRWIDLSYRSNREGKRTWCICRDIPTRVNFINWVKQLLRQAREVLERWKGGDYSIPYPIGLYPPSRPKNAEALWPNAFHYSTD